MLKLFIFACLFSPVFSAFGADVKPNLNVLMVGWDGSRLARVEALLKEGKLPVLASLIKEGSFVHVTIKTKTDTKAGWAEILTGYDATVNRVFNNRHYSAIPPGLTLFERLRDKYGMGIANLFFTGKSAHLGTRGPHNVCINCVSRMPGNRALLPWWDEAESKNLNTLDRQPRKLEPRDGEPYFHAIKAVDFHAQDLKAGRNVLKAAEKAFSKLKGKPFFAFLHFEEPDEQGHNYGEHSEEYTKGLLADDQNLGKLLKYLKKLGLRKKLKIFVMGDHGFDVIGSGRPDDLEHDTDAARYTFLVSNLPFARPDGDRRDFTPTILKIYGIDPEQFSPPLQGKSYF